MATQTEASDRTNSRLIVLITGFVLVVGLAGALVLQLLLPTDPVAEMAKACENAGWSYYDNQTSNFQPRCVDDNGVLHFIPRS